VKVDITISNRFLELGIPTISWRLEGISHMIEITVFYRFCIGVKKPTIHHSDTEMVGMRFPGIERSEVLTRHSFIDEYCSREWNIINIRYIDMDILFSSGEIFLTPADEIGFVWIRDSYPSIDIDIGLDIIYLLYSDFSYSDIFESFSPMSSRTR
jgi:hypothetical protein